MEQKRKRSAAAKVFRGIGIALLVIVLLAGGFIAFLSATEYRSAETEAIRIEGNAAREPAVDEPLSVLSWNVGYAALDENADFFMDGGKSVRAADAETVQTNLTAILAETKALDPDVILFQEVDVNSSRSRRVDEYETLLAALDGYSASYAQNYKVSYVPYPMPPLGKVDSGVATFSSFAVQDATRVQLPVPFSWPIRTINLKRCLLVSRIPVSGTDKELVLVNLHLEAYDDGEGKEAQTRMLAEFLNAEAKKGNYVIAGGDFNQTFSSVDDSAYPAYPGNWASGKIDVDSFGGGWQFLMDESVPGCRLLNKPYAGADRDTFQYYLIDGFIVSANVSVDSIETQDLGFAHSDHNPVLLTVTLNP